MVNSGKKRRGETRSKQSFPPPCHCEWRRRRHEVPLCGTPLMSGTKERGNPDTVQIASPWEAGSQ